MPPRKPPKAPKPTRMAAFRLPEDLIAALDEAHWVLRKTKTEVVIEALKEYLQKRVVGAKTSHKKAGTR